jgi:hypothetical protein
MTLLHGFYRLRKKGDFEKSSSPQRLKPDSYTVAMYGLKAVPFREARVP